MSDSPTPAASAETVRLSGGESVSTTTMILHACNYHRSAGFNFDCGVCAVINGYAAHVPMAETPDESVRERRLRESPDDYPRSDSHHEGFAGIRGVTTDRWCRICEMRIDQPHRLHCPIGGKEMQDEIKGLRRVAAIGDWLAGEVERLRTRLAEAERVVDGLRQVMEGCGQFIGSSRRSPFNCGERLEGEIKLCGFCEIKRDVAICNLTGADNG